MFFSKNKTPEKEINNKLHELVKIISIQVAKLQAEVELINGKLRKAIYGENLKGDVDGEELLNKSEPTNDGFDELRQLRKSI